MWRRGGSGRKWEKRLDREMEDIEDYSIFGITIGGKPLKQESAVAVDLSALSGLIGGAIFGLSISEIFSAATDSNYLKDVQIISLIHLEIK